MKVWVLQCSTLDLSDCNQREVSEEVFACPTVHSSRVGALVWAQEFVAEEIIELNKTIEDGEPHIPIPTVQFDEDGQYECEEIDLKFQVHEVEVQGD